MESTKITSKAAEIYFYDDCLMFAEGLAALINDQDQLITSRCFCEETDILNNLGNNLPDLLFVHCNDRATMKMILSIHNSYPTLPILIGIKSGEVSEFSGLKGIDNLGYYCLQSPTPVFFEAVKTMLDNQVFVDPQLRARLGYRS